MKGKLLIVEDEPIVALDLKQEVEQLGCEVVGVAESADEALVAAATCRPDLALLDIRIVGSMDGILTARMLRNWYHVPAIFLTSYSDDNTISRAAKELPYGYLTKPFLTAELKAALKVGLHKASAERHERETSKALNETVSGMREALVTINRDGRIQFMNAAAEGLTGTSLDQALGRPAGEILSLSAPGRTLTPWAERIEGEGLEEFGCTLKQANGATRMVDLSLTPLTDVDGQTRGCVVTLRDAAERMRCQAIEQVQQADTCFENVPMAMVQLDAQGHIVRVNKALLEESGVAAESLIGRSLTGLSMDPDPKIARDLMHKLLGKGAFMGAAKARAVN